VRKTPNRWRSAAGGYVASLRRDRRLSGTVSRHTPVSRAVRSRDSNGEPVGIWFQARGGADRRVSSHRENRLPTSIMFSCGRSDEPLRSAVTVHRPGAKMFERRVVWHRLEPVSWRILRRSATGQALVRARVVFGELNFSLAMRGCRVSWCSCLRSLH